MMMLHLTLTSSPGNDQLGKLFNLIILIWLFKHIEKKTTLLPIYLMKIKQLSFLPGASFFLH